MAISSTAITIKTSLAKDLNVDAELRSAIRAIRNLSDAPILKVLNILDRTIQQPAPGQTTREKVSAYDELTKAIFSARAQATSSQALNDFLQALTSSDCKKIPASLALLSIYALYNTEFASACLNDRIATEGNYRLDRNIRELFGKLASVNNFQRNDVNPFEFRDLFNEISTIAFDSKQRNSSIIEATLGRIKEKINHLYSVKRYAQAIENFKPEQANKLGDLSSILGEDLWEALSHKFSLIQASEDSLHNAFQALGKTLTFLKQHVEKDLFGVLSKEIQIILESSSEIHLNKFFTFLDDFFNNETKPSYDLLKNALNKYRLQALHHDFLAQAQFYESGNLIYTEPLRKILKEPALFPSITKADLAESLIESRELLYQHLGFDTLQYDAASVPGQTPLLLQFAEDIGVSAPLKIRGDVKRFPGKGFIMNGINLYKAFGLENNDQDALQQFKKAFNNLVSDKAFDLASELKATFLKGKIILSHPELKLPLQNGNEIPYSFVLYNDHFKKTSPVEVALVATQVLDQFINPSTYPAASLYPESSVKNICDSNLSLVNLIKESQKIGANVYDLLHYANFVTGSAQIAALNEDLSYNNAASSVSDKISQEIRPLYLELMRLSKIALYHYKANTKVTNENPETNALGMQNPWMDLMAQEVLYWHEYSREADDAARAKIPVLCFIDPLRWSSAGNNIYIDPIDLSYNFRSNSSEAFHKTSIKGGWDRCVIPLLYEHNSNKFIEPCFVARNIFEKEKNKS